MSGFIAFFGEKNELKTYESKEEISKEERGVPTDVTSLILIEEVKEKGVRTLALIPPDRPFNFISYKDTFLFTPFSEKTTRNGAKVLLQKAVISERKSEEGRFVFDADEERDTLIRFSGETCIVSTISHGEEK